MAEPQPPILPETSSHPQIIPEAQQSLFREVLSLLEQKKVPFAVAGAFALRQHTGISRDTKDLDLFLTSSNAVRALKILRERGLPVRDLRSGVAVQGASRRILRRSYYGDEQCGDCCRRLVDSASEASRDP